MVAMRALLWACVAAPFVIGCVDLPPEGLPGDAEYGRCIFGSQWASAEVGSDTVCFTRVTQTYTGSGTEMAQIALTLDGPEGRLAATFKVPRAGLDPTGTYELVDGTYGDMPLTSGQIDLASGEEGVQGHFNLVLGSDTQITDGRYYTVTPSI